MPNYSTSPEVYNFSDGNGWGGNGWGGIVPGFIGGILGGALFGNGFGGWNGNGNNAAAAALGAQATANNNTDLIMSAVGNIGTQVAGLNASVNQMAIQGATSPLQVSGAIKDAQNAMQQQFSQCCCENRLANCEQTNTIVSAIKDQTVAMNDQFCAIKERELQQTIDAKNDIIAQLRDQAMQNANNVAFANLQAQIAALAAAVAKIPTT